MQKSEVGNFLHYFWLWRIQTLFCCSPFCFG